MNPGRIVSNFDSDAILQLSGLVGVAFYLVSYSLLQLGLIRGSGYPYAVMNLFAAVFVLASLMQAFNFASALVQIFWILISLIGIGRLFWQNKRIRFNEEEYALVEHVLPRMPKPLARRLLNGGTWVDWRPGTEMTQEGRPVTHLHYLLHGEAEVISGGRVVAELYRGLIGEMNVMARGPASATVRVAQRARVFTISGATLQRLADTDREMSLYIEQHLNEATKRKLIEANARLAREGA